MTRHAWWVLWLIGCHPAVRTLPMPSYDQPIGTAHPIELVGFAGNGRWLVACQARVDTDHRDGIRVNYGMYELRGGDELAAYLFRGGGTGAPIDALVANSRDDRWIAIVRDGELALVDDRTGVERVLLGADLSPRQRGLPRAAAFDAASQHLIYFRSTGTMTQISTQVIVRELATGDERALAVPDGLVWSVEPEPSGPWAKLEIVEYDTDGDGTLRGMNLDAESAGSHSCKGRLGDEQPDPRADTRRRMWLNLETGAIDPDLAVLGHVDGKRIIRSSDKAIRIGGDVVVPAECDATLITVTARPLRIVATCAAQDWPVPVEVFGPGFHAKLSGVTADYGYLPPSPELFEGILWREPLPKVTDAPALCLDDEHCVRIADGEVLVQPPQRAVVAGSKLVAYGRGGAAVIDVATGHRVALREVEPHFGAPRSRHIFAFGTNVVDVEHARVLGEVMREPLMVDATGRALLPAGGCERELCLGPLRWVTPRPRGARDAAPSGKRDEIDLPRSRPTYSPGPRSMPAAPRHAQAIPLRSRR